MGVEPQILDWHNKKYTFKPDIQVYREDSRNDVDQFICGADTESTDLHETGDEEAYEPQCISYSLPWRDGFAWVASGESAIDKLLASVLADVPPDLLHKAQFFFYVHNLGYDVPQFFKARPDLMAFARAGVYQSGAIKTTNDDQAKKWNRTKGGYFVGKIAGREIFLKDQALFIGNAPHFTFRCFRNRDDYVDISFLDSGSFFRGALSKIAEQLKLPIEKDERQADLGRKDWRLVPDGDEGKAYFEKYAIKDARVVRLVGEEIVKLHKEAGFTALRKSAPAFANAYFMKIVGEMDTVLYSGSLDPRINQLALDAYAGGRTGGIVHGKVSNISVFDFASSYPTSMLSLPSFTPKMKYQRLTGRELEWENVWELLQLAPNAFLRVDGVEKDGEYPALIQEKGGRLTPVFGEFTSIATTGAEVIGGVLSGSLVISRVRECVLLYDTEADVDSPFAVFATRAYEMKKREQKDTIPYLMAKLLLNSAYGKWIQSSKEQYVGEDAQDYVCLVPTGYEPEFARAYLEAYARAHAEGSEVWDALDLVKESALILLQDNDLPVGVGARDIPFHALDLSEKEFAPSAIPAAAALVTGISRARLRALCKCLGAKYWDTDSAFIEDIPEEELLRRLAIGTSWLHPDFAPLEMGNELGNIDKELDRAEGWLAGTKRYYLTAEKEPKFLEAKGKVSSRFFERKWKIKQATHGLTALEKKNAKEAIRSLATGENFKYRSKAAPLKAKQTTDKQVGRFVSRDMEAKFRLDPRMEWEWNGQNFEGRMKEWETISN